MLRDFWNRLTGRSREEALEREAERETMSPEERHVGGARVDDIAADEFVGEHLGGVPADRLDLDDES